MEEKRKGNGKRRDSDVSGRFKLKDSTWHAIWSIVCFALSIFFTLAIFKKAGIVGGYAFNAMIYLFGSGYYLLPLLGILLGISFLRAGRPRFMLVNTLGGIFFLIAGLGLIELGLGHGVAGSQGYAGGLFGYGIYIGGIKLFGIYATAVFLVALLLVSLLLVFESRISFAWLRGLWERAMARREARRKERAALLPVQLDVTSEEDSGSAEEESDGEETVAEERQTSTKEKIKQALGLEKEEELGVTAAGIGRISRAPYTPPPLSLLNKDSGKPSAGDIKANANIIKRTLANFGIEVEMDEIIIGPSITRYALKPAEGVKLSKIVGLQNDLSMALAAHPLRIEAPIPGKSLVGIEIPN